MAPIGQLGAGTVCVTGHRLCALGPTLFIHPSPTLSWPFRDWGHSSRGGDGWGSPAAQLIICNPPKNPPLIWIIWIIPKLELLITLLSGSPAGRRGLLDFIIDIPYAPSSPLRRAWRS